MSERRPWDKRNSETPKQFRAFDIYRKLGTDRSIRKVAETLELKSWERLEHWSTQNNWVSRVNHWEDWQQEQFIREEETAIKEMAARHAQIAKVFTGKVIDRLSQFKPEELTAGTMPQWFEVAVKVERLSRGVATERNSILDESPVKDARELMRDPEVRRKLDEAAGQMRVAGLTGGNGGDD